MRSAAEYLLDRSLLLPVPPELYSIYVSRASLADISQPSCVTSQNFVSADDSWAHFGPTVFPLKVIHQQIFLTVFLWCGLYRRTFRGLEAPMVGAAPKAAEAAVLGRQGRAAAYEGEPNGALNPLPEVNQTSSSNK